MRRAGLWIVAVAGALGACGLLLFVAIAFVEAYDICPAGDRCWDAVSSGIYFLLLAVLGLLLALFSARKLRSPARGG